VSEWRESESESESGEGENFSKSKIVTPMTSSGVIIGI
jgi:hypothetical protein